MSTEKRFRSRRSRSWGRPGFGKPQPSIIPALPEKLRAPRPTPDPETIALDLLRKHFAAYMRVVRLIDDIGKLPHNNVNIPRPPEYDEKKRALLLKFSEDYAAFQQDFETAVTLLEAVRDASSTDAEKKTIGDIISAAQQVATTVAGLIAWTEDRHNEPVSLGMLHDRPGKCDEAREAGRTHEPPRRPANDRSRADLVRDARRCWRKCQPHRPFSRM